MIDYSRKTKITVTRNMIIIILVFAVVYILPSCGKDYENHALAFKNLTADTIHVIKYYGSQSPRTFDIAPDTIGKIFETSTETWLSPSAELKKCSDSIVVQLADKNITFAENYTTNSMSNPYYTAAQWEIEVEEYESSSGIGSRIETLYIHYFAITGN